MEHNQFYRSGDALREEKPRGKKERGGGGVFATVVIVIVLILLALLVVGLFWPQLLGGDVPTYESKLPTVTAAPIMPPELDGFDWQIGKEPVSEPTPTPVVPQADRNMPMLDGVLPTLPDNAENPMPAIFEAASPGVVSVINYISMKKGDTENLTIYGSGSGFIVSSDGYILTNAHVVEDAAKVTVKLIDGDEVAAKVIGQDIETDVAVLKIDRAGVTALPLGNSDEVRVGEYVLAIGNPIDADKFQNTLTSGIISAFSREITIDSYTNNYLQTDAAINVGNSGGPLLNMKGEVIGINSAKTITAGYDSFGNPVSAEGIGFALPINQVLSVLEQLITKGQIQRPGIGIVVSSITEATAEANGVPVGVLVVSVVKDGPGAKAEIKAGDIITEANGAAVAKQGEFTDLIKTLAIGDQLELRVYRDGEYLELTVTVANKSDMNFDDTDE